MTDRVSPEGITLDVAKPGVHGHIPRGLTLPRSSPLFSGRFGRIFRALPPADFGPDDDHSREALKRLGTAMVARRDRKDPKDGPDDEESGIPAAYTYLGQFIDHDLTFDPASSLQRQNDPDALVNYRTPRFDLDNVYGRGPDDQPYLYKDGQTFLLGKSLSGSAPDQVLHARDLPRNSAKDVNQDLQARAIIGDPRNDENVIVSQLQGLFLRFHNRLAADNPNRLFPEIQRAVRFHYQWIVVNDFLPRIVSKEVLNQVLPHLGNHTNVREDPPKLIFYTVRNQIFMPLEFSVAAYRFGHSMVRPGYRLNDAIGPLSIFTPTGGRDAATDVRKPTLAGFDEFPSDWAIDWARFIDLTARPYDGSGKKGNSGNSQRMQLAYKIDTSLVDPLARLPDHVVSNPPANLAQRNLLRGWMLRLPSGQDVARAMGAEILHDEDILIGKFTGTEADIKGSITEVGGAAFRENCPLWTYILAETKTETVLPTVKTSDGDKQISTPQLGAVGGRIVAETFAGLLNGDSTSYFNVDPLWKPFSDLTNDGQFRLKDLIAYALGDGLK
jgi:hypothetical protein